MIAVFLWEAMTPEQRSLARSGVAWSEGHCADLFWFRRDGRWTATPQLFPSDIRKGMVLQQQPKGDAP